MSLRREVPSMEALFSSANAAEQFLVTDWAALQPLGNSNIPAIERLPSLSRYGSESLAEIMSCFVLPESTQMGGAACAQEFPLIIEHGNDKNLKVKKRKKLPECGNQNVEGEKQKHVPIETAKSSMAKDEKKQKNETSLAAKETNDAPKEDYIHIRAKRGQATNSHSLAERVRREKISERMRLLQDIVPGCNKITGKAMMLDEIINYVQLLQKQVEFLSMKLATVNPEVDLDIEQIFRKENFHSSYGSSPALGYRPQLTTSHPQLPSGTVMPSLHNPRDLLRTSTSHQISPMVQMPNSWDNEFQNAIQNGLIPNLPHEGMELNGSTKMEL